MSLDWQNIRTALKSDRIINVRGYNWGDPSKGRHYARAMWDGRNWIEVDDEDQILEYLTDWRA